MNQNKFIIYIFSCFLVFNSVVVSQDKFEYVPEFWDQIEVKKNIKILKENGITEFIIFQPNYEYKIKKSSNQLQTVLFWQDTISVKLIIFADYYKTNILEIKGLVLPNIEVLNLKYTKNEQRVELQVDPFINLGGDDFIILICKNEITYFDLDIKFRKQNQEKYKLRKEFIENIYKLIDKIDTTKIFYDSTYKSTFR